MDFILVISLEEIVVVGHPVDQMVPILGRQRRHAEGFSGRVKAIPSWRIDIVPIGFLKVHDPRFVIDNHSRRPRVVANKPSNEFNHAGIFLNSWNSIPVDVVDSVAWIEAVIRRDWRSDVGDAGGPSAVDFVVKDFVFVEMSVAEKLAADGSLVPIVDKML